jgi:hypothetical protein
MEQRTVDIIQGYGEEHLDRWLSWWDDAEPTAPEERPALAQLTEDLRRVVAVKDPANSVATRLFGQDITDNLVSALWGEHRVLPRAGL